MRLLKVILLTGTVLPGLTLGHPVSASPDHLQIAQGGPDERGPRGGEPPHGGGPRPERGPQDRPGPPPGPPAGRERPEPRPERTAPPRERPEPPAQRPPQAETPRERAPERRPEPPAPRPPAQDRPQERPDRQQERQERQQDRQDRQDRQQERRNPQPDRPDRGPQERPAQGRPGPERQQVPDREERPAPLSRPDPERPPAPGPQRQAPDRDRAGPDGPTNRPAQRDAVPDRGPPGQQRPGGPGASEGPQPGGPPAGPGRPGQRLDAQPENRSQPNAGPGAEPGRPVPPNMAPGVPGRPFQPRGAEPDGRAQPQTNGAPGADPGRPVAPNMAPGIPGRPFVPPGQGAAPGQAPPATVQPGMPAAGGAGQPADPGPGAFNRPGQPGYVPGGFRQSDDVRDYEQVRRDRREYSEGGRTFYREPGRIIVRDRDGYLIRHDENERFRDLDPRGYRYERRGSDYFSVIDRPGGEQIVTVTDDDGRLLRRYRRFRDGREVLIIDNSYAGPPRPIYDDVVVLPPPDIRIPRDRYIVDYEQADEGKVYEALTAPPVVAVDRRYTLDQIRYSPDLRARMRSVDIDTITFDTGSFTVTPDQAARLSVIAAAINRAIRANPQEVFLIEGYTDAVGSDIDNLSLSDRRAQSVATVLTQQFQVPPENLTTQGYGEQYLKVNTQGPSRENRRVTVRRITPLLQQGQAQAAPPR
jgi:outer membrane protein OmpA-like peptidoglycan-associated protein